VFSRNKWVLTLFGTLGLTVFILGVVSAMQLHVLGARLLNTRSVSSMYQELFVMEAREIECETLKPCSRRQRLTQYTAPRCKYSFISRFFPVTIISKDKLVSDLLSIFAVVYEVISAILTTARSYQALCVRINGGLRIQRKGLTYLVLEQGKTVFLHSRYELSTNGVLPSL